MRQTILPPPEVKIQIIADTREMNNPVVIRLSRMEEARLVSKQLDVADYICSERVGVERKTVDDFINSIFDQRIFRQARELTEAFESPVIIIEGNPDLLFTSRNVHSNTIRGALSSIAIDFKIPIIWTRNPEETANQLFWMAKREQVGERNGPSIRCMKRKSSVPDMQEFLVAGLPHIDKKMSGRLLKKFRTPKKVFSATEEHLMKVEGIGKEKAKRIFDLLNSDYEKSD